ncbi:MAG: hypothetical protein HZA54_17010 [Planctomycetes bacterium]|nr:hypothetical protein [Planctomycetota bacterium]
MKEWVSLHQQHRALYDAAGNGWSGDVRKRLVRLADRGHCEASVRGRFTPRRFREFEAWRISPADGSSRGVRLLNVPDLESASLIVEALAQPRSERLLKFTCMVEGLRPDSTTWTVAIHLEAEGDDRKGNGACGHPSFHCHVGPDLDARPRVRVPLPDIGPMAALDWLIATLVPGWEPAPWPAVAREVDGGAPART